MQRAQDCHLRRAACLEHGTTQSTATEAGRGVHRKARHAERNWCGIYFAALYKEDGATGKMSDLGKKHVQRAGNPIAHRR